MNKIYRQGFRDNQMTNEVCNLLVASGVTYKPIMFKTTIEERSYLKPINRILVRKKKNVGTITVHVLPLNDINAEIHLERRFERDCCTVYKGTIYENKSVFFHRAVEIQTEAAVA